ncbi:MAG: hypothetical protein ACERKD_20740 [Prolixibacteraceae bacterium]
MKRNKKHNLNNRDPDASVYTGSQVLCHSGPCFDGLSNRPGNRAQELSYSVTQLLRNSGTFLETH